jgi:ubiquinone/menaquinone biosynthesis C-methylase UbiE
MPTPPPAPQEMTPLTILQVQMSFMPARTLIASVQLGLFSALEKGPASAAEVAARAGVSRRGARIVLDALASLGLVEKRGETYANTPAASRWLVRESPEYIGHVMEVEGPWKAWSELAAVVRTGKPARPIEHRDHAEEFFPHLVRGLHVVNREPAARAAAWLVASAGRRGLRVLDVAAGSGVWGIALAEADREARVTAHDFPRLLDVTREYATRHGVADRFDYLAGDLKKVDFGEARYDVAILGNIVHSEGEASARDLFRRIFRALRGGGRMAIVDMIPDETRTAPPFPVMFAVNMLVATEEGDTYTLEQYREWIAEAGFARTETADIASHSPLVVGVKA